MKALAFNGGPRKNGNTATVLNRALEGAASQGAETELIHLYDLNYKGCISCFACKRIGGESYGRCAVKDDLTLVFSKIEEAGAVILGTPIYLGAVTGEMKSFIERLIFPYLVYDKNHSTLFKKKMPTGFIYTMGVNEDRMKMMGYDKPSGINEMLMKNIFGGTSESLFVNDTYQFDDYSKYVSTSFSQEEKAKRRKEAFPNDCKKAFDMGVRLVHEGGKKE
ncbi:MAG TPA: flavodoxin [Firmicutes bacterium]|jgi:multimeric flavodoxin WrbA|nr:flavodoxin [Bacillota bacterium]